MIRLEIVPTYRDQKAMAMDEATTGPRLWCTNCGEKKVLSPCYTCQASKEKISHHFCRGGCLSSTYFCEGSLEICKALIKERLLLEIDRAFTTKETILSFAAHGIHELPEEIWQLTHLKKLDLCGNFLTELPKEIRQLIHLKELNLDHNKLNKLPAEIGQLTHLKELSLNYNELTLLPAEIAKLSLLQYLNLYSNKVTDHDIQGLEEALPSCKITA